MRGPSSRPPPARSSAGAARASLAYGFERLSLPYIVARAHMARFGLTRDEWLAKPR
jgi:hypothetical protein